MPMLMVTAQKVAKKLIKWITSVGIPHEILSDQGKNFMLNVLRGVCEILKIRQVCVSLYCPQTDGLVERFNHTLKAMIKTCIQGYIRQ